MTFSHHAHKYHRYHCDSVFSLISKAAESDLKIGQRVDDCVNMEQRTITTM